MTSKRDVLDEQMAQRFRWRVTLPGDLAAAPEPPAPPAPPAPEGRATKKSDDEVSAEERERWEHAARACAELARQVERAWAMTVPARQAAATASLLERVERLSFDVVGMREHPLEAVRLWRLVVRHYAKLPRGARKSAVHTLSFAPLSPHQRELVDLLVEAAETGDGWLTFMLERGPAEDATGRKHPDLGARLARVLERGSTWAARETAARWLSFADLRDAIPALRRAIRQPHARLRWAALEILVERAPESLTPDDVRWLLEDAVEHPTPRGFGSRAYETAMGYEDVLVAAVAKVPPPDGWKPLEIIADGGGAHIRKERAGLDSGWALRALAAGYPERALARIDRELATSRSYRRRDAVEAAGLLPDDLARPRLLEGAAGPGHHTIERAKALWFERFGEACPVTPLAGLPTWVLSAPPSEKLLSRLAVLQGSSDDARGAMLEVLIAEAPTQAEAERGAPLTADQRETLALLLYSLRDLSLAHRRPALPATDEKWVELLLERFGDPAFEGLAALAAQASRAGVDHEWLGALASRARTGGLRPAWRDRLREIACAALASPAWGGATSPLVALTNVGAPPELMDRLWSIAMTELTDDLTRRWSYSYARLWAADALAGMKDAPALDDRIAAEGEAALAARDFSKLERVVLLGSRRRTPAALDLGERCIALVDDDPAAQNAAQQCAYALEGAGRIGEAWLVDALSRPESLRFSIAARLCRRSKLATVRAALESALGSPARAGSAACEAAEALVAMEALPVTDPCLAGIIERAPARARGSLLGTLLHFGAAFAPLRVHFMDLLLDPDEKAAENAFEDLYAKQPEGTWELFEAILPLQPNPAIREAIQRHLGEPSEAEIYWRDGGDDDEEEDDEDLLEDEDDLE